MSYYDETDAKSVAVTLVQDAVKSGALSFENFTKYSDATKGGKSAADFVATLIEDLAARLQKL
ncbi:hypothetical protein SB751_09675 [Cupriavidus sp. SIMBA_020]|uniref:hypothetical protein n=1 Tax=Cupriavidus sp. SIMBA_020 TaxID=3085766 RepID=UPI003979509F